MLVIEIIASVDSAPWLRLRLLRLRASLHPPVRSSSIGIRASLSPSSQFTLISTPVSQKASPVTAAARAQASASAATWLGCWSKEGRSSPRPQPPAGTTDRWPLR